MSGIQIAYQLQKHTKNVEHVIYEKNENLGGTWLENKYPGMESQSKKQHRRASN